MELINLMAEAYARKYSDSPGTIADDLEKFTLEEHTHSHMLSGALQGKFLEMICSMIQPKRILEIGTFTGYSALCMAKSLSEDAQLHTIELREEDAQNAQVYFEKAGLSHRIVQHVGNAKKIIPNLEETWDLVFIDADKVSYIDYYELTLPNIRKGGWILADNVFFHGQVLEETIKGKNAIAMNAFNRHVHADPRVEQVILTIRDGLMLIQKK